MSETFYEQAEIEGGACQNGRCKCKNKRGKRCGLCSQQGTDYCHLHQWCMDPAMRGMTRNGWMAPPYRRGRNAAEFDQMEKMKILERARMYSSQLSSSQINSMVPSFMDSITVGDGMNGAAPFSVAGPLTAVATAAASTIGAAVTAVPAAVGSLVEAFGDLITTTVPDSEDEGDLETRLGRYLKPGGVCDTLILPVFRKPSYSMKEFERIYSFNADKFSSAGLSQGDVEICLRKNKKIDYEQTKRDIEEEKQRENMAARAANAARLKVFSGADYYAKNREKVDLERAANKGVLKIFSGEDYQRRNREKLDFEKAEKAGVLKIATGEDYMKRKELEKAYGIY